MTDWRDRAPSQKQRDYLTHHKLPIPSNQKQANDIIYKHYLAEKAKRDEGKELGVVVLDRVKLRELQKNLWDEKARNGEDEQREALLNAIRLVQTTDYVEAEILLRKMLDEWGLSHLDIFKGESDD